MERLPNDKYAQFQIKNNVPYQGTVGYKIYRDDYDIFKDNQFETGFAKNQPRYQALSE